ncbi:potassium channel family protein [Sphaerotilus uruguayifluvii]|uniref:Voltage-gated potassium channel n=1 Tax=Sphaerotilus uruguayifluvii TaxID=2735897 RepID=A0ABX2G276_9BURK|nr:potassium channel family protein [Leptothrix sp. C29]NRT56398.1 voltage-gated potassium channel [Leptothrix sp. C29]
MSVPERSPSTFSFVPSRVPRHWLLLCGLVGTIPAFYLELLSGGRSPPAAAAAYLIAALIVVLTERPRRGRLPRLRLILTRLLIGGLVTAALLPPSSTSTPALVLRSLTALLTLMHMVWCLRHLLERDSLPALLGTALGVLMLCGAGFWWLEPRTPTLADGLWLAFTTAATVGYGDVVPSTPASKIFSVFVVLLGFGILSLVTASIAAMWVETTERQVERDILQDLHAEIGRLRTELRSTHAELQALQRRLPPTPPAPSPAPCGRDQPSGNS